MTPPADAPPDLAALASRAARVACVTCGCRWRTHGDGTMSLADGAQRPGPCCDNAADARYVTASADAPALDLAALEALMEHATPAPWTHEPREGSAPDLIRSPHCAGDDCVALVGPQDGPAIAALRNAAPMMLAELAMRRYNDEVLRAIGDLFAQRHEGVPGARLDDCVRAALDEAAALRADNGRLRDVLLRLAAQHMDGGHGRCADCRAPLHEDARRNAHAVECVFAEAFEAATGGDRG